MFTAANKGSYVAQAGQANPLLDAFKVTSAYSFDAFDLAKSGMQADAAKYIAKKENEAKRDYYKTMGETNLAGQKQVNKAADYAAQQQRMAGGLGLLGALSYGTSRYFQNKNNQLPPPEKRQSADNSAHLEALSSQVESLQDNLSDLRTFGEKYGTLNNTASTDTNKPTETSATGGVTPTPSPTSSSTPASYKFTGFDDLDTKAFGIISKYEGGSFGFDAVNQGGSDGGHSVPEGWYSGTFSGMKQHGGRKLSDLTLKEIFELQRDPGRSVLNDSEWVKSGKIHAAGAYQFIGSTLKDEVTKMGLDLNSKFTPQLQSEIAKSHAIRLGGIKPSTWIGLKNMTPEERKIIAQWNSRL